MKGVGRLFFLAALAVLGQRTIFGFGAPTLNPFPLGTIGCKLSEVCAPGQLCKDDQLFGSCESRNYREISEGEYEFQLSQGQLVQLGNQIWRLISKGFSWKDAYTQCSLQNMLLGFAKGETFDTDLCEETLSESDYQSEVIQEDIATVLQKLMDLQDGRRLSGSAEDLEDSLIPNSIKRDEFVDIHKYFDRSKGQYKRDPFMDEDSSFPSYLTPLGVSDSSGGDLSYLQDVPQQMEGSEYPVSELDSMRDYLQTLERIANTGGEGSQSNEDIMYGNFGPTEYVEETAGPDSIIKEDGENADMNYLPLDQSTIESQMKNANTEGTGDANEDPNLLDKSDLANEESLGLAFNADEMVPGPEAIGAENGDTGTSQSDEAMSISPPDEKTLEELLEGKLEANTLDDSQLKRLTKYVESMVDTLDTEPSVDSQEGVSSIDNSELDSSVPAEAPQVVEQPSNIVDEPQETETAMEKKATVGLDHDETGTVEKKPELVNTRYVNLALTHLISPDKVGAFVMNLSLIIGLNATAVNDVGIHNGKVLFEVQPNPYMNASEVADKTNSDDVKTKVLQRTGYEIKNAGIGNENQVEFKQGNKYVVLTFILVGSIAGILLAVIVIYVVKRHTLSKKKLAQLSATGETNEASKDYQDLCRQRMQSKSSEKPEPLHAASRIGSVSEAQVRSPSSRSSTSSWSEEPVASNMDISTGHIVLSYMEDHLKNQDRLDQEWEALCAYEADPCATAVAADASNTRKNRYGDILPYDHSRVVISTAANVSGSDYVNANFITDHDPRNPAFIATQGPLPHTVADFWQMVWEQGSVVIVMLTKLTENGTAMCHRYWPEEGSDLYHIYEVHLVSEHIWCDDYLVRSFYLKNLQTNETRTVTQFHFLTWPNLAVPGSIKALLDFRRKVNKSYRGRSCPIVVHCSDGCGRTGTYCLIDMVLNRMAKGAKEIDMAATLEHIRDQRMAMVKTKEQFQFSLAAVAEEVHAILKALPQ